MKRRPKDIGTDAERAVVRYLKANGWPHAERRALRGNDDAGDITGTPGLCWEVKSRNRQVTDTEIADWLAETDDERVNAGADLGVLVVRRPYANVRAWWAIVPLGVAAYLNGPFNAIEHDGPPVRVLLADVVDLLRAAGYGDPLGELPEVTR